MEPTEKKTWEEDRILQKGTILYTLSYQPSRTRDVDMFYAVYDIEDLNEYLTMFNGPLLGPLIEDRHKEISAPPEYKYVIKNLLKEEIRVASEPSGAAVFAELISADGDFKDFVLEASRMQSLFPKQKYLFKGYVEAGHALRRIRNADTRPDKEDLFTAYRLFNYVLPASGGLSEERAADIACQRDKFLRAMRAKGYGAAVDTNDAIYGGYHAKAPLIVFAVSDVELLEVQETTGDEKQFSSVLSAAGRLFEGH